MAPSGAGLEPGDPRGVTPSNGLFCLLPGSPPDGVRCGVGPGIAGLQPGPAPAGLVCLLQGIQTCSVRCRLGPGIAGLQPGSNLAHDRTPM